MYSQPLLKGLLWANEQVEECCSIHCALASGTAPCLGTVDSLWPLQRSKELWGESERHDFISHSAQRDIPRLSSSYKTSQNDQALYGIYTFCIIYTEDGAKKTALMRKFQPQRCDISVSLAYKLVKAILLPTYMYIWEVHRQYVRHSDMNMYSKASCLLK